MVGVLKTGGTGEGGLPSSHCCTQQNSFHTLGGTCSQNKKVTWFLHFCPEVGHLSQMVGRPEDSQTPSFDFFSPWGLILFIKPLG